MTAEPGQIRGLKYDKFNLNELKIKIMAIQIFEYVMILFIIQVIAD